jgi:hypothetical protein
MHCKLFTTAPWLQFGSCNRLEWNGGKKKKKKKTNNEQRATSNEQRATNNEREKERKKNTLAKALARTQSRYTIRTIHAIHENMGCQAEV